MSLYKKIIEIDEVVRYWAGAYTADRKESDPVGVMAFRISANCTVGITRDGDQAKAVRLSRRSGQWHIEKLSSGIAEDVFGEEQRRGLLEPTHVSLHSLGETPLVVAGVDSRDVLIRQLEVPLHRQSDIDASIEFQAEPMLPYPVEEGVVDKVVITRDKEGTLLTLLAVRHVTVEKLLKSFQNYGLDPEIVSCVPQAIANLTYLGRDATTETSVIIHIGEESTTIALVEGKKLLSARGIQGGASLLAVSTQGNEFFLELCRSFFALTRQWEGPAFEKVRLVGPLALVPSFIARLQKELSLAVVPMDFSEEVIGVDQESFHHFAIPLGLALSGQSSLDDQVDFRQKDLTYKGRWQRLQKPLIAYVGVSFLVAVLLWAWGRIDAQREMVHAREGYVQLLALMGKSYDQFEEEYRTIKPVDPVYRNSKELVTIGDIDMGGLDRRLAVIATQTKVLTTPMALLPDVPLVSDVLAWLTTLAANAAQEADGTEPGGGVLQLENFSYTMVKRPDANKPKERYQVRIDLEFSAAAPRAAREFHKELLAPNNFIDTGSEVTWSVTRQRYRTSFILKDKTRYPS